MIPDFNQCMLSHPAFGEQPLRITQDDMIEEKEIKKCIRDVERMVRTSTEYKRWLEFIHGVLGGNFVCYKTGETPETCKIQVHHHPITMYEYVEICMNNCNKFDAFQLAEEVMSLHYANCVGFIPLCTTEHEKYHNFIIQIPMDIVEGNWMDFVKDNEDIIPEEIISKVTTLSTVRLEDYKSQWYMHQQNYLNVNTKFTTPKILVDKERIKLKEDWI